MFASPLQSSDPSFLRIYTPTVLKETAVVLGAIAAILSLSVLTMYLRGGHCVVAYEAVGIAALACALSSLIASAIFRCSRSSIKIDEPEKKYYGEASVLNSLNDYFDLSGVYRCAMEGNEFPIQLVDVSDYPALDGSLKRGILMADILEDCKHVEDSMTKKLIICMCKHAYLVDEAAANSTPAELTRLLNAGIPITILANCDGKPINLTLSDKYLFLVYLENEGSEMKFFKIGKIIDQEILTTLLAFNTASDFFHLDATQEPSPLEQLLSLEFVKEFDIKSKSDRSFVGTHLYCYPTALALLERRLSKDPRIAYREARLRMRLKLLDKLFKLIDHAQEPDLKHELYFILVRITFKLSQGEEKGSNHSTIILSVIYKHVLNWRHKGEKHLYFDYILACQNEGKKPLFASTYPKHVRVMEIDYSDANASLATSI
jgi:hypothetical protein